MEGWREASETTELPLLFPPADAPQQRHYESKQRGSYSPDFGTVHTFLTNHADKWEVTVCNKAYKLLLRSL